MAGVVESGAGWRVCVGRMVGGTLVDGSVGRCASGNVSERSVGFGIGMSARAVV